MNRLFVFILLLCNTFAVFSQEIADSVAFHLKEQLRLFPQEKVALHVDRTVFLPGDTIRLKAYVTDASTLRPELDNQFVYVELLNAKNRSMQRVRLIASNNLYTGYIPLPVDLQEGVYYLWAYTLYSAQVKDHDCIVPIQVGGSEPAPNPSKTLNLYCAFSPRADILWRALRVWLLLRLQRKTVTVWT